MSKHTYIIAAHHDAFGLEGSVAYVGTERGARRAANKIARLAGHGWTSVVALWTESHTPAI